MLVKSKEKIKRNRRDGKCRKVQKTEEERLVIT